MPARALAGEGDGVAGQDQAAIVPGGASRENADNNRKLVRALADVENTDAHFYCAIVYLRQPSDPAPLISTAQWQGRIIKDPQGSGGFGYDPHFYLKSLGRTAAELTPAEKAQLSHRGQAVRALCEQLGHER